MKFVLDKLVNYNPYNQAMCHQMAHTILANRNLLPLLFEYQTRELTPPVAQNETIEGIDKSIPSQIKRYTTNLYRMIFTCNNTSSVQSPAIVKCLARSIYTAHKAVADIYTKYNTDCMRNEMHNALYLHEKEKRGAVFTEAEKASKVCVDPVRDMGFKYAMADEKMVTKMARWMVMCVEEVEKLMAKGNKEGGGVKRMFWGDFPDKSKKA